MPGDPAENIYIQNRALFAGNPQVSLDAIRDMLGLSHDPMLVQYWHFLANLAHGNLGVSISRFPEPVTQVIRDNLPWTLFLVGLATLIAFVLGTALGMICAWHRGGILDELLMPLTAVASSFPVFFLALVLLSWVTLQPHAWFPTGGNYSSANVPDLSPGFIGNLLYHTVLPAFTLVVISLGGWLFGMRNAMINTLSEDYVTMATAKGLRDRRVMFAYAARNAVLPQVTGFAMALGSIVGGTFIIELVFNYQGIGFYMIQAVNSQDYPLVQGLLLMITLCVLLANFAVDLLYGRLDPRVRTTS